MDTNIANSAARTVREAADADREAWNALLAQSGVPPLGFFEWRRVLEDSYGARCRFLLAEDESGTLRGVLPLYLAAGRRAPQAFGLRFGFAAGDAATAGALLSAAADFGASLTVGAGYEPVEAVPGWTVEPRTTVMLDLSAGEESVWRGLRDKTRNAVRKGGNSGLTVEWDAARLAEFYRVYLGLMASKDRPAHALGFFLSIFRNLPDNARLMTVHADGRLVGGSIVLCTPTTHMSTFQAAAAGANARYNATTFMEWEMARRAMAEGVRWLDMGESTPGSGTYKFKTNFGGKPRQVHYLRRGPDAAATERAGKPEAKGPSRKELLLQRSPMWLKERVALWRGRRGRII
jgi:hypothetical protein